MKYRAFIEKRFLIDEPETGKLVPFKFRKIQIKYYNELCRDYDIENKGITAAIRDEIVKARREGFSSIILALFAADDILNENPTETQVISYRDDATNTFRKRYRIFVLSNFALKNGITVEQIQKDPNVLEQIASQVFSIDSGDSYELAHNKAHFYCGTAAARTGGRGGVLQKLLLSEAAHYPDTEKMTAKEVIDGTMRQVDINSGWIFIESTGNGRGNYFYKMVDKAVKGLSRFKVRFYGWRDHYTEQEFSIIASEFADPDMLKQEYPGTIEEAFLTSISNFTTETQLLPMVEAEKAPKEMLPWLVLEGVNYIDQCEVIKDYLLALERSNPYYNFYVGVDIAKAVDKTVVTPLKYKTGFQNGGIRCISFDSTGAGDFMPDWFEKNSRWKIERIKFSQPMKDILYKNLQSVIAKILTALPLIFLESLDPNAPKQFVSDEARMFWEEMLNLQKKIIGRLIIVNHPNGEDQHDDFPDSWALAEHSYVVVHGVPKDDTPRQEDPNPDPVQNLLNRRSPRRRSGSGFDSE